MKTLLEIGAGPLSWHQRKTGYEIAFQKESVATATWEKITWQWSENRHARHPMRVGIISGDGHWTFECHRDSAWKALSKGQVELTAAEAESGREVARFMGETGFLSSSRFVELADGRKFPWAAQWKDWRKLFSWFGPYGVCGPDGEPLVTFDPDYLGETGKIEISSAGLRLAELPILVWFGFYISRHESYSGR